jgi:N-methylhydantoinase A
MQVGVDIGGTFTDLVLCEDGGLRIHPEDPAEAMLIGLQTLLSKRRGTVQRITHGSTVATNAILERKGARTALLTTGGSATSWPSGARTAPIRTRYSRR